VALTKQAALEWGPHGVRVNAVAPGMISGTDMSAAETDELRTRRGGVLPLRRTGQPDDVADVVLFLLSDMARYVTGQIVHVDGGWSVSLLTFTPRPWEE
jgi:NAD(P)-dependent dehydrogenase (short-subunit alcohol dehydrogenase family)